MTSVKPPACGSAAFMLKYMKDREERVAKARRELNLRPQDHLTLIDIPKESKVKGGTYSYKKLSAKARRLQGEVAALRSKIARCKTEALPKAEQSKKLARLRCCLAYAKVTLSSEIEASPNIYVSAQII